ncbi:ras-like protein family member 10B [Anabrus simplex]|uniref:ras-like protein family member 10B n=1 Tax=Anabrus simplex TaxID=316456 RepID=UPI0034DD8FDF
MWDPFCSDDIRDMLEEDYEDYVFSDDSDLPGDEIPEAVSLSGYLSESEDDFVHSDGELDLDYFERRGEYARLPRRPSPETEASPDSMDLVKVILLGAPAVGKTSIIQQFVWNDFSTEYVPTDRKHTYYPSVIINDHLYELKISDIPVIPYFPVNSYYEWTDYRFYGLRSATAYILVFDISNVDTFQYIRTLHDQMFESRDMRNVPILVVGNKQDLLVSSTAAGSSNGGPSAGSSGSSSGGGHSSLGATAAIASCSGAVTTVDYREKRRDIVNLVKKHWKCAYVECSAKYNWRVVAVFKELMRTIDMMESGQTTKEVCSPMMDNIHDALDRNKCSIL